MFLHSLYTLILSASPLLELRGAIPLGIVVYSLPIWLVLILALVGNIIPPLFLIPIIGKLEGFLENHFPFWQRVFAKILKRTRDNHEKKFEYLKEFALVVLVAIPFPLTGAWSASLAAYIFGIPYKKAIPLIFLGLVIASVIVTLVTIGVVDVFFLK